MRFRSLCAIALGVVVAAAPLAALQSKVPDVSGTWSGKATAVTDGKASEEGIYAVLKQTDSAITGTVGPRADRQQDIATGKIAQTKDGVTVAFDSGRPGHTLRFSLKLVNDVLSGTVADEYYPATKITVEFKRDKAK